MLFNQDYVYNVFGKTLSDNVHPLGSYYLADIRRGAPIGQAVRAAFFYLSTVDVTLEAVSDFDLSTATLLPANSGYTAATRTFDWTPTLDQAGKAYTFRVKATDNQQNSYEEEFNWGYSSPAAEVNTNQFSIRWSGKVTPAFTEKYTFYTLSDDGVRLWINDRLLIDDWTEHSADPIY